MFSEKETMNCRFCFTDLWHEHTFIRCTSVACVEIGVNLCLQCFAAGTEDDVHKSNDQYKVLCNAIKIKDHLWSAQEEIILLDTFENTMSWEKVGQKLNKSPKDCESHYFEHFVLHPKIKELDLVNKNAFRYEKFEEMVDNRFKTIGDAVNLEGTYHIKIINQNNNSL